MSTAEEALALGWRYHQAGQFVQAEQVYRQLLQHGPKNADAASEDDTNTGWEILAVSKIAPDSAASG